MADSNTADERLTEALRLRSRILFQCADPDRIRAQLAGRSLTRVAAGPLRDDVSTTCELGYRSSG